MAKEFTIISHRRGKETKYSGTLEDLVKTFSYTLSTGQSYAHEKGNKKINCKPKTAQSLVTNLNNAKRNAAANGCSDTFYTVQN